jgi:hypothetical protein
LQPANDKIAASANQQGIRILGISGSVSFSLFSAFHLEDRDPAKTSADRR